MVHSPMDSTSVAHGPSRSGVSLCRRLGWLAVAAVMVATVGVSAARAHTFVPVSDATLIEAADVVARDLVTAARSIVVDAVPHTEFTVEVAETLKGQERSELRFRVPGGVRADGMRYIVSAVPSLSPGEEVLLFLAGEPGAYAPVELALGAFHVTRVGADRVAFRAADLAVVSAADEDGAEPLHPWIGARDAEAFTAWIRKAVGGQAAEPDYFLRDAATPRAVVAPFSLPRLKGNPARWPEGQPVFRLAGRLDGVPGAGRRQTRAAARAWNAASSLRIAIRNRGGGASSALPDGVNGILFEDPADEIPGAFDCARGGTLAVTSVWVAEVEERIYGHDYFTIVESDIVVQDGVACALRGDPRATEEMLGTQLGHAVGIGSSSVPAALMFPVLRGDGAGARLHVDDYYALRALAYARDSLHVSPRKPWPLAPLGEVRRGPPEFLWRGLRPATGYEIWIYESRTGANRFMQAVPVRGNCGDLRCAMSPPLRAGLEEGVRYRWRVRALYQGIAGPWSPPEVFRIVR